MVVGEQLFWFSPSENQPYSQQQQQLNRLTSWLSSWINISLPVYLFVRRAYLCPFYPLWNACCIVHTWYMIWACMSLSTHACTWNHSPCSSSVSTFWSTLKHFPAHPLLREDFLWRIQLGSQPHRQIRRLFSQPSTKTSLDYVCLYVRDRLEANSLWVSCPSIFLLQYAFRDSWKGSEPSNIPADTFMPGFPI